MTNKRYAELMTEIEGSLKARPDYQQLDWVQDATRMASDEELMQGGAHTQDFITAMQYRTAIAPGCVSTLTPKIRERTLKDLEGLKGIHTKDDGGDCGWTKDSELAARTGVAALIDCSQSVLTRQHRSGFVMCRPPSHHVVGYAERAREGSSQNMPAGFGHLNSIAAAIENLRLLKPDIKVCIFDFDVHPGNGNQDTVWDDPSVLTISLHQAGVWPGPHCCAAEYIGGPNARNSVLNIPIPAGSGDDEYRHVVEHIVFPRMRQFKADFIFVAAGFDALKGDPYADMKLSQNWYGWCIASLMAQRIGPITLNLEGGYNPRCVAQAANACVDALAGVSAGEFLRRSEATTGRGASSKNSAKRSAKNR